MAPVTGSVIVSALVYDIERRDGPQSAMPTSRDIAAVLSQSLGGVEEVGHGMLRAIGCA